MQYGRGEFLMAEMEPLNEWHEGMGNGIVYNSMMNLFLGELHSCNTQLLSSQHIRHVFGGLIRSSFSLELQFDTISFILVKNDIENFDFSMKFLQFAVSCSIQCITRN